MFDRIQRSRFLTLPVNQTDTMMAQGLTSFVVGLNRTNVTDGTVGVPTPVKIATADRLHLRMPQKGLPASAQTTEHSLQWEISLRALVI